MISRKSPLSFALKVLKYLVLALTVAIVVAPLPVIASTSFKTDDEICEFPLNIIPRTPILDNFGQLLARFPTYIFNSIKLTVLITLTQLITASTGAYAFSKLKWKGRDALFFLYVISIMIPAQAIIIPQFIIVKNLGFYDSHWALVLTGSFTAFGTFLIKQFFMTIPDSYVEAARIDGAKECTIFTRIILPLARPALGTRIVFAFRFFWNDFFGPLIYLFSERLKTLPLGMSDFATEQYTFVGPQMAATLVSFIPVMIIFFSAQRFFVEGTVASGVKG